MQTDGRQPVWGIPPPEAPHTNDSCFQQRRNKPQFNNIAGPMTLMYVSGSHMAWGIASPVIKDLPWAQSTTATTQTLLIISWFLGAIIGSVVLLFLNQKITKKLLFIYGAAFCTVSSALMILFSNEYALLLVARVLAGIGHGLVFSSAIIHGSENCMNRLRPQAMALMQTGILAGFMVTPLFLELSYATEETQSDLGTGTFQLNGQQIMGALNAFFSIMALIIPVFYTHESVVTLAARGQDQDALNSMTRIRRVPITDHHLQYDYQEIKAMIQEDKELNNSPLQEGNGRAMTIVLMSRVLLVLSMSYGLNMVRVKLVAPVITEYLAPSIGLMLRVLVVTIASILPYWVSRKILLLVSGVLSSIALLIVTITSQTMEEESIVPGIVFFAFDAVVGIGVTFMSDVYMGEAFPVNKKMTSAFVCTVLENVLHIILVGTMFEIGTSDLELPILIVSTVLFFLLSTGLFLYSPEIPPGASLRAAKTAFRTPRMRGYDGRFGAFQ